MKTVGISIAAMILTKIVNYLLPSAKAMTTKEMMIIYMLTFLCISVIWKDGR